MSVSRWCHVPGWMWVFAILSLTLMSGSVVSAYDYHALAIPPLLGTERSFALGINNQGQVVGRSYNFIEETGVQDRQAFIWDRASGVRALATLSGESVAWGINQAGSASGYSFDPGGQQRAAWWNVSTNQITDIGTLTGPTSTAYGINESGAVVGNADIPPATLGSRRFTRSCTRRPMASRIWVRSPWPGRSIKTGIASPTTSTHRATWSVSRTDDFLLPIFPSCMTTTTA